MIGPCGINCGICTTHLRAKDQCGGCNTDSTHKPKHCLNCAIKTCDQKPEISLFCFDCKKYPCPRLKKLDQRYITKYGMSPIDNLNEIKKIGLKKFMRLENTRWSVKPAETQFASMIKNANPAGNRISSRLVK
jgi:hypothetical protein